MIMCKYLHGGTAHRKVVCTLNHSMVKDIPDFIEPCSKKLPTGPHSDPFQPI